jgi:hypothetical protein
MNDSGGRRAALSQRSAEIAVAALFIFIGAVVMFDSVRLGWRWGEDGPQPGYFPFYVGLLVSASSLVNLVAAMVRKRDRERVFVELGALKLVLKVLVPAIVYVAVIAWTGIYVASTVFIAFFMRWLGKYAWWKAVAVSVGTSVFFFLIFETWFKVPLPKGPLESFLGVG